MAKAEDLEKGDRVEWSSHGGTAEGKVVAEKTSDFSIKGQKLKASEDDPRFVVESESSGGRAGHKASALEKKR